MQNKSSNSKKKFNQEIPYMQEQEQAQATSSSNYCTNFREKQRKKRLCEILA